MEKLRMIIVAFFMMQFNALFSQNWVGEFSLEGKINDIGTGRIVLSYNQIIDGKLCSYSDATDIVDGKFCFRGTINEPSFAFLSINDSKVCIMLDAAPMKITFSSCDIDNYHLIGSLTNDENRMIKCEFSRLGDSLSVLNKKIEELKGHLSPKELDRIERQKDSIWLQRQRVSLDIVKINPHSFMALKYLSSFSPNWLSLDEAQKIYDNFTADQKCVPTARLAAFLMENKRISMVGKRAPDFQFVDDKGLKHFLSDF
jgi:hypothetical protein